MRKGRADSHILRAKNTAQVFFRAAKKWGLNSHELIFAVHAVACIASELTKASVRCLLEPMAAHNGGYPQELCTCAACAKGRGDGV